MMCSTPSTAHGLAQIHTGHSDEPETLPGPPWGDGTVCRATQQPVLCRLGSTTDTRVPDDLRCGLEGSTHLASVLRN
jgi:hypothetical protein